MSGATYHGVGLHAAVVGVTGAVVRVVRGVTELVGALACAISCRPGGA